MKIGIGIDTGGTCTDAVIYNFEEKRIMACAKASTTREDLSVGIEEAISKLPEEMRRRAEAIALSTTLATNACVENKGGRGKLFFFGANPEIVKKTGAEYGLTAEENLFFVDSRTNPNGFIQKQPDWDEFRRMLKEQLRDTDAVGVVEFFALKTGAVLEKKARAIIQEESDIPVVCGHELFEEYNIVKRGASTLLNARLLSTISEFIAAVKAAMLRLKLDIPFVIVRSDGSLMSEEFAKQYPVETLLCGPVASVMGAGELTSEQNALIVDIGGTTTDIAFVKNGIAKRAESGVHIGNWDTFVKGLFVDTFGLGGDSLITVNESGKMVLSNERAIPLSMIASKFPEILPMLDESKVSVAISFNQREEIYVALKPLKDAERYTEREAEVCKALLNHPMNLGKLGMVLNRNVSSESLKRLVREGAIMRCGVTPTDAMHILGDFTMYSVEAAYCGIYRLSRMAHTDVETFARNIYAAVEKKLFVNIGRILFEERYKEWRSGGISPQLEQAIGDLYDGDNDDFLNLGLKCKSALVGVGAPTHVFLPRVGEKLGAKVIMPEYAGVANALGAIVGNVVTRTTLEVGTDASDCSFILYGKGIRESFTYLNDAKERAKLLVEQMAREENTRRGGSADIAVTFDEEENYVDTTQGSTFLSYRITAVATGDYNLK
ncbi:MAG: hydantoinase/oxoprolinase family protein [Eubacteriaceae bacterium]|nr:hydantoinase/oxoprolinase family protein [Eubacteriaceae bacterium]